MLKSNACNELRASTYNDDNVPICIQATRNTRFEVEGIRLHVTWICGIKEDHSLHTNQFASCIVCRHKCHTRHFSVMFMRYVCDPYESKNKTLHTRSSATRLNLYTMLALLCSFAGATSAGLCLSSTIPSCPGVISSCGLWKWDLYYT